ncbi:hypothetical protein Cgig2_017871 [Carnegiea gigantea]|uniref:Uncharacterized protein n=1 Tax=Carnegiea gigantea TaxID=171969 RepID=A0A9Q1KYN4_9CARY|nr:hypothetical protein Cgig2_017871 [Carnegiea gigantea]
MIMLQKWAALFLNHPIISLARPRFDIHDDYKHKMMSTVQLNVWELELCGPPFKSSLTLIRGGKVRSKLSLVLAFAFCTMSSKRLNLIPKGSRKSYDFQDMRTSRNLLLTPNSLPRKEKKKRIKGQPKPEDGFLVIGLPIKHVGAGMQPRIEMISKELMLWLGNLPTCSELIDRPRGVSLLFIFRERNTAFTTVFYNPLTLREVRKDIHYCLSGNMTQPGLNWPKSKHLSEAASKSDGLCRFDVSSSGLRSSPSDRKMVYFVVNIKSYGYYKITQFVY